MIEPFLIFLPVTHLFNSCSLSAHKYRIYLGFLAWIWGCLMAKQCLVGDLNFGCHLTVWQAYFWPQQPKGKIWKNLFLGPRGPLGTTLSVHVSVRPQRKSRSPLQPYKSSQDHHQPIKPYILWKLMTPAITHRPKIQNTKTKTQTNTNTKTKTK